MRHLSGLALVFLVACASEPTPPITSGEGLDRCAEDGAVAEELWDVDNLHGEIVSMTIGPDGTAVVGTADGAVKQWSLGASAEEAPLPGERPSYGEPFTESGQPARALAIGAGGDTIIAADDGVGIHQWSLADSSDLGSMLLKGSPFTAVVARSASEVVVADVEYGGQMRVVDLTEGPTTGLFETTLWGVTGFVPAGDAFFVVGHWYGMAAIERRTFAAPEVVADLWDTRDVVGWIHTAALSLDGSRLVTGGDGHVMVFDAHDLAAGPVATTALTSRAVAFSGSADHVAVALDDRVVLLTADLTTEIASIPVPTPSALALDPSAERLVIASTDGRLRAFSCR